MPAPEHRRPAVLDMLAGVAALLGGSLLLSARGRRLLLPGGVGEVEIDTTARAGRGRPAAPPGREAKRLGHETRDADTRAVGLAMLGLAAAATGAVVAMVLLLGLFHRQLDADRPAYTAEQTAPIEPPRPRLEAHPETDLHRQNAGERAMLDSYAWSDPVRTRARIPIARGMALVVGRSLDAAP